MKFKITFITLFLGVITLSQSQESIKPTKFGKGIFNIVGKDSTFSMKIGARFQFLSTTMMQDGENPETSFLVRRARLKFDGFAYSPKLTYKLELGLSNRDLGGASVYSGYGSRMILDAVLKYNFYKNFVVWGGQTKLPGNRERVISSANLQQVDRSLLNAKFTLDRDVGFQLRHHFTLFNNFIVRESFALSQGEGRNIITGNLGGHQYTGRIELLPFGKFTGKGDYSGSDLKREPTPKLSLASSYDHNNNAVKTRSNQGSYMETDYGYFETNINTLFVDAMFKYNGFSFMAEYAKRNAKDPIAKNSDGTETGDIVQVGTGLNFQSGYLFKKNWEISGRFSNVKLDENITGKTPENQYTLGLSKFIVGHSLKVQTDVSYIDSSFLSDTVMWRLQFDIHF